MRFASFLAIAALAACGNLDKRSLTVSPGDSKEQVVAALGTPDDRQFRGSSEAWQYCVTGAGFGYHDYRVVWFDGGRVTGLTSYKDSTPGRSCVHAIRPVRWEEAPHQVIEVRTR